MPSSSLLSRFRSIKPIESIVNLKRHLQLAIEIEHATIPPYLTALYSLKGGETGRNAATYKIIRQVLFEEMLHLALAANLLNAVGASPSLANSSFIPKYPTQLPESNTSFFVHIARCSNNSLRTFMRIEKPQYPLPPRPMAARPVGYRTIGEFYANIKLGFQKLHHLLGDALFSGDPARQLIEGYAGFGGRDDLVKVVDLSSAEEAIDLIVEHGEGTGMPDPELPADERPHFFNFKDIRDRCIIGPDGQPLPDDQQFDPNKVWRMVRNPRLAGDHVRRLSIEFNEHYSDLLCRLEEVFNGYPSTIYDAWTAMRNCREAAMRLVQIPIGAGRYAVPTFEFISRGRPRLVATAKDFADPVFTDVKVILDNAIDDWIAQHGRTPQLARRHEDMNFGWETSAQLLASTARGLPLIDPNLIGNGMGHQTNLVIALRSGIPPFRRMPAGGPYLDDDDIDLIVRWINAGCPDAAPADGAFGGPAAIIEQSVEMLMRDPEVSRQPDLVPYPDGPGKLIHKWLIGLRFDSVVGAPIQLKVRGIPGGSAGVRPGTVFDGIAADNVYQNTGSVYNGTDADGCLVLQRAAVPESTAPVYDPTANHFPNPNATYPFRRMNQNGRWFRVQWQIRISAGEPTLSLVATQQPRVASVADRVCP